MIHKVKRQVSRSEAWEQTEPAALSPQQHEQGRCWSAIVCPCTALHDSRRRAYVSGYKKIHVLCVLQQSGVTSPDSSLAAELKVQTAQADTLIHAKVTQAQCTQPPGEVHTTARRQQREIKAKYLLSPHVEI